MGRAYYNEFDKPTAAWLRELIRAGLIMDGEVDERSITEVSAADLVGFERVHMFADIGGWDYALRLAGWPDDLPVWTGSCPCPPFSSAGKKKSCPTCGGRPIPCPRRTGFFICVECEHAWHADGRHLWPEFWRLIRDGNPSVVFGEQVASEDGRIWLAGVRGSLEILGRAVGAADMCSAGASAPNLRQRIWWVAESAGERPGPSGAEVEEPECWRGQPRREGDGVVGGMAESQCGRRPGGQHGPAASQTGVATENGAACGPGRLEHAPSDGREQGRTESDGRGLAGGRGSSGLVDAERFGMGRDSGRRLGEKAEGDSERQEHGPSGVDLGSPGAARNFWSAYDLVYCRDEKYRRVEPGTFPLASGVSGRVGKLRGYGNAINPEVAATFIEAYLDHQPATADGE